MRSEVKSCQRWCGSCGSSGLSGREEGQNGIRCLGSFFLDDGDKRSEERGAEFIVRFLRKCRASQSDHNEEEFGTVHVACWLKGLQGRKVAK